MTVISPNPGAVASLADVAATVLNAYSMAGTDSTGQRMVKVRRALMARLQSALREVYPDERAHNLNLANALKRRMDE